MQLFRDRIANYPSGWNKGMRLGRVKDHNSGDCHARVARSSGPGNSVMYNSRLYHHRRHHRGRLSSFLKVALAGRNEPFVPR